MKVSVVLPAYNSEKTVLRTVNSVLNQSYRDLEILVINDGSTDRTLELLNTITDPRFQVFTCKNSERANARNLGIKYATGDFIAFIDADDLWTTDKLEQQVLALTENSKAGVAYSWTRFIDEYDSPLYDSEACYYQGDVYEKILLSNFIASGSNILVRRKCVDLVGLYDTEAIPSEDWDYCIRLAQLSSFVVVPKYQVLYRKSSNSSSSNVSAMEKSTLRVISKSFDSQGAKYNFLKREAKSNAFIFLSRLQLEYDSSLKSPYFSALKLIKAIYYFPLTLMRLSSVKLSLKIFGLMVFPVGRNLFSQTKNF
ncbi:MAG TPA: glycosyltransferase family 2 protein [Stenomitos sp.]